MTEPRLGIRELSMSCFALQLPDGSNSTVEEKLWQSILMTSDSAQKAFSAEIHVCFIIELVCCPWTVWIRGHRADRIGHSHADCGKRSDTYLDIYHSIYHAIFNDIHYDIYHGIWHGIWHGIYCVINTWGFCPRK
jgi:hypothetical protein